MFNWNALGVADQRLSTPPEPRDFPPGINRANQRYWTQAVNSVTDKVSRKAWDKALTAYIRLCELNNTYPFDNRSANNDEIYNKLIRARRTVVRFIEAQKVNTEMVVRTTERSVAMTPTGFVLRCIGHCDFLEEPPSVIRTMGIRKAHRKFATQWEIGLGDNTTFFVANDIINMAGRWHYGYEVKVDVFPFVPGGAAPTSNDMENFILKIIYLPILRAYRPIGLQHRLV